MTLYLRLDPHLDERHFQLILAYTDHDNEGRDIVLLIEKDGCEGPDCMHPVAVESATDLMGKQN